MHLPIQYIKRNDLDTGQWNRRMDKAANGLLYGYTFYLDRFARNWDALVLGDYEMLMALPWNSKFGVKYLYQPPFTPVCGIYGGTPDPDIIHAFIDAIPKKFRLVEISLRAPNGQPAPQAMMMKNYVLPLDKPYETLYGNYRDNIRRNIKKAVSAGCTVQRQIPVADVVRLAKQQLGHLVKVSGRDFEQFEQLYEFLRVQENAITYGVFGPNGELLASSVFFYSHTRAYYILVGNTPNGKTLGASHYLVDRFIADHAGSVYSLDFEGSDIASLAFFYESFGAHAEQIIPVRRDELPWYVKMVRR